MSISLFEENLIEEVHYISEFDNALLELGMPDAISEIPKKLKSMVAKVNTKSAISEYKKYLSFMTDKLSGHGIDVIKLKKDSIKAGEKLKSKMQSMYDKKVPPAKASAEFKQILSKHVSAIIKKHTPEKTNFDLTDKVVVGFMLFLTMFIVQFILFKLAVLLLGVKVGLIVTAVLIAPITEEAAKSLALQKDIAYGKTWTFGFAITEMALYMIKGLSLGLAVVPLLIGRIIAVLFHMTTANIQAEYIEQNDTFAGYVVAVLLHSAWNLIAVGKLLS